MKKVFDFSSILTGPAKRLILLLPLICLAIVTCAANVIVMICTRIDKRLKTVSSLYVFSLAIADTIVGFAVMGPMTVSYFPIVCFDVMGPMTVSNLSTANITIVFLDILGPLTVGNSS